MPLLGLVLLVITASEIHGVLGAVAELAHVVVLFAVYLVVVPAVAIGVSKMFGLTGAPGVLPYSRPVGCLDPQCVAPERSANRQLVPKERVNCERNSY